MKSLVSRIGRIGRITAKQGMSEVHEELKELHLLEAHEIVSLLKAGSVTPLELIDVVEERIKATEDLVHATPITCFERARDRARKLPSTSKERGFLHGLPILVKDCESYVGKADVIFDPRSYLL